MLDRLAFSILAHAGTVNNGGEALLPILHSFATVSHATIASKLRIAKESRVPIIIVLVVIAVVVVVGFLVVGLYNGLVQGRLRVRESYSGIDVQLKRRASLIPNLVETVRGTQRTRKTYSRTSRARAPCCSRRARRDRRPKRTTC